MSQDCLTSLFRELVRLSRESTVLQESFVVARVFPGVVRIFDNVVRVFVDITWFACLASLDVSGDTFRFRSLVGFSKSFVLATYAFTFGRSVCLARVHSFTKTMILASFVESVSLTKECFTRLFARQFVDGSFIASYALCCLPYFSSIALATFSSPFGTCTGDMFSVKANILAYF